MLKDYHSNVEELSKKNKTKPFVKGLKEIKDPSTWPKKGQFDDYSAAVEQSLLPVDDQPTEAKRRKSTGGQNDGSGGEKKKRKRNTEVSIVCASGCCCCICVYSR